MTIEITIKNAVHLVVFFALASPPVLGTACSDRRDVWVIGDQEKRWCNWAERVEAQTLSRCEDKDLYDDCPITCNSCPTTPPSSSGQLYYGCEALYDEMQVIKSEVRDTKTKVKEMDEKIDLILDLLKPSTPGPTLSPTEHPSLSPSFAPIVSSSLTPSFNPSKNPTAAVSFESIEVGGYHACAIDDIQSLWCWGGNEDGQIGLGFNSTGVYVPFEVTLENDPVQLSLGITNTCVIDSLSKLWCWGSNNNGQLGMGDYETRDVPTEVPTSNDPIDISFGEDFICMIDAIYKLWCWGDNFRGQLGLGDHSNRNTPTEVNFVNDVKAVSLGRAHACLIDYIQKVWCWGANNLGQLGIGADNSDRHTPTEVTGVDSASAISLGIYHSCAINNSSGTKLWCWGYNFRGQLGLGDNSNRNTPTEVNLVNVPERISAGDYSTCIIDSLNKLWCWGARPGVDNSFTTRNTPAEVILEENLVKIVSVGFSHSCLIDIENDLWCWGGNFFGELGIGGPERYTPTLLTVNV